MLGERSSVFKSILLNPLVWVGIVLTVFTLNYDPDDVFSVFFAPVTYRNLAIAAAFYVALFGRKYTDGMNHLDWNQTLGGVIKTMLIVLLVWFFSLFVVMYYRYGGETYSHLLRQRYKNLAISAQGRAIKGPSISVK